jgi:hypothetical protein
LVRPKYESLSDVATQARSNVAGYVDEHPELRPAAYTAANALGIGAGVVRGGYHMAKGLADAGVFAGRLVNPLPDYLLGRTSALEETLGAGAEVGRYVANGVADPRSVGDDIKTGVNAAKAALVPSATPVAATTSDELARRWAIGMNQGEVGANVASLAVGGPLARAVGKAGEAMAVRPVTAAKYIAQGYSPKAASRFAEPYYGMGSHWVPRRENPPAWFRDSDFNVLKPPGIARGEMYELHGRVDPNFRGAYLGPRFPGESWKFAASGLERHGPLSRIWHGAPGPLKARAGGIAATVGGSSGALERSKR